MILKMTGNEEYIPEKTETKALYMAVSKEYISGKIN